MKKSALGLAVLFTLSHAVTFAQDPTKSATYVTNADVQSVLKAGAARKPPAVDQMLAIVDLKKYNLGVGIIHRGPTQAPGAGRGNAGKKHQRTWSTAAPALLQPTRWMASPAEFLTMMKPRRTLSCQGAEPW